MVGDGTHNEANEPDVVGQLSKKLGLKVVLQMENSDGEVVFEDTVNQSNASHSADPATPGGLFAGARKVGYS